MHALMTEIVSLTEEDTAKRGLIFENIVRLACRFIPKTGDAALDIGAHVGYHTVPLSDAVGSEGQVIAFEPLPPMIDRLTRLIARRNITNVALIPKAAGNIAGVTCFSYFERYPAYSGIKRRKTPFSDQEGKLTEIEVEVVRVDDQMIAPRPLSLIKLDIEGGELDALKGARATIAEHRPVIVFENGLSHSAEVYGYHADDFFTFFESLDYTLFTITGEYFGRDLWLKPTGGWEYVALPADRSAEASRFRAWARVAIEEHKVGSL